ncbi:MAG: sn-glycerol-3-phosphate ABC transporter ATP-binding protein UgpC [Tissierellia bacterium]|nr:sn-glycerol-3-phosphate ABC transporter ATP-binding protein UgpC [Tissierellia bacterium]
MRVELINLGKKYEGRENFTIRGVDLVIEDREFCVILGPSGCGKSTLLRMIAGLNSITEGELRFGGKRMNSVPPKDRDIAMVFQSYALYPHMSVYDNMAFSLSMRKESKHIIDERVREAADLLQITDYLYSKPSDISGGQRQRVALGRAMVRKPKVFLMDEPLSNLDAKLREHMRIELVRLHKSLDTTTIYVTHDQTEAMTMATKIVLMDDGRIQQVGKPDEFYNKPINLFVAGFIGSPTMNIFEGKFQEGRFHSRDSSLVLTPSQEDLEKLRAYEGKEIYLGIRSERFHTDKDDEQITVMVDVVEMLGKEKILYTKLGEDEVIISVPGHKTFEENQHYGFSPDKEALHFFDGETRQRIN